MQVNLENLVSMTEVNQLVEDVAAKILEKHTVAFQELAK